MSETVLIPGGGKVVVDGDRCEIHLPPIVVHRKHWIIPLSPREEARRTIPFYSHVEDALAETFSKVRQTVYREPS